jgi:galactose-1-phosphate uridylyltransferase
MERLKRIKDCLICVVESHMDDLDAVDAKEMGEVIDMIKDLSETMYYCSIVKAMEEGEHDKVVHHTPTTKP